MERASVHVVDGQDSRCPKCQEPGQAMSVVVGHGVKTVQYHCVACPYDWLHTRSIPHIPVRRFVPED